MNSIHVKDVEITLNTKIFLAMLTFSGILVILGVISSYYLKGSLIALTCSWIIWITAIIIFNYLMVQRHRIVKDVKIEFSTEEEEEKVYTVMKIE